MDDIKISNRERKTCQMTVVIDNLYRLLNKFENYISIYDLIPDKSLKSFFAIGLYLQWDREYEQQKDKWGIVLNEVDEFNKFVTLNKVTNPLNVNGKLVCVIERIEGILYESFDGFNYLMKNRESFFSFLEKYNQYEGIGYKMTEEIKEKITQGMKFLEKGRK